VELSKVILVTWQLVLTSDLFVRMIVLDIKRPQRKLTKRVGLCAIGSRGITNSNNKFSRATALATSGRQGNLEDGGLAITIGRGRVGITSDEGGEVDDSIGLVTERKGGASHNAEKLRVGENNIDRSVGCSEPAIVPMTLLARKQVVVVLELCEVLAHVIGGP
jgi:hypothetical protein